MRRPCARSALFARAPFAQIRATTLACGAAHGLDARILFAACHESARLSRSSMPNALQLCSVDDASHRAAHDRRANAVGPLKELKELVQCR
jgi:hypothetical protein